MWLAAQSLICSNWTFLAGCVWLEFPAVGLSLAGTDGLLQGHPARRLDGSGQMHAASRDRWFDYTEDWVMHGRTWEMHLDGLFGARGFEDKSNEEKLT